jgi:ethanolaminephosphotransferase
MLVPFYTTQWEEYFTGTLVLGYIGVTEAQMTTLGIYLVGAIFGTDLYIEEYTVFGVTAKGGYFLLYGATASSFGHVVYNCITVYQQWRQGKATAYNALGYLVPVSSVVIASSVWLNYDATVITAHAHLFCLMLGLLVANFVGRIIVYRVCALDAAFFPELLLPLCLGTLNSALGNPIFSTYTAVLLCFLFYTIAYLHFAVCIINQMTTYLNIRCFVIPVPNLASNPPVKPAGGVPTPSAIPEQVAASHGTDSPSKIKSRSPNLSPTAIRRPVKV